MEESKNIISIIFLKPFPMYREGLLLFVGIAFAVTGYFTKLQPA
jgi:hypothetical protein